MQTTQSDLQNNVLAELRWEPGIDSSRIGVAIEKGVVELTGQVRTFTEKRAAEAAVKRVRGVFAVANELEVDLLSIHVRSDVDIAKAAIDALRWNVNVPDERLKVSVDKGWVTLEGSVSAAYQRLAAEYAVESLTGVKGVLNHITVAPATSAKDVRRQLTTALHRYAQLEADAVQVAADGAKVTLTGKVHSWAERDLVQGAAWRVPGVTHVDNRILVTTT
ncbi:MAG TPA: BON domain-containing protein [Planctomycetota bacterium]